MQPGNLRALTDISGRSALFAQVEVFIENIEVVQGANGRGRGGI